MLNAQISLFIYMIEMLISFAVFSRLFQNRYSSAISLVIGMLIFSSGAAINILFSNTVWINVAYTLVMNFIFSTSCFKVKAGAAMLYSILMDLLSILFEFITIFSVSSIIGGEITEYNSDMVVLVIESGISKIFYFLACILLLRRTDKQKSDSAHISPSFFLYPVSTLMVLLVFWYICAHVNLDDTHKLILAQTSLILLAATVVLYITFCRSMEKENELFTVKNKNLMLQAEKTHYDLMKHQNSQLMLYAHDAKKHLSAIQGLNSDPVIDSYLEKLLCQLKEHSKTCHSGNKFLDVIIDKYASACQMHGVDFSFDVHPCCLDEIDEIDLVSILCNLLDNALDAASKSTEKKILFETTERNSYYVIVISNSSDTKPVSGINGLISTKEDGHCHGYGIKSVVNTLKKYHGDFDYDYNESTLTFTATVIIYMADKPQQ